MNEEFSKHHVYNLVSKDDFCEFAQQIREELLNFPEWIEMTQTDGYAPGRQNGLTTGHLPERSRGRLPYCLKFRDLTYQRRRELCELVGVEFEDHFDVETNAMAYGEGCWLSPHTDDSDDEPGYNRLLAWMLYLTHPEDGEWSEEKGGALRIWTPNGEEARVRPKFNRLVLFKVSPTSYHEIEKVTWKAGWERCRLALSGWIRGAAVSRRSDRGMSAYLKSANYMERRTEIEASLQGALALRHLMVQQRTYSGLDITKATSKIREITQDYDAHLAAPDGTSFLKRIPGPKGCITVLDVDGKVVHFGSPATYPNTGDS